MVTSKEKTLSAAADDGCTSTTSWQRKTMQIVLRLYISTMARCLWEYQIHQGYWLLWPCRTEPEAPELPACCFIGNSTPLESWGTLPKGETVGLIKYNKKLHKSTKTNQFMSEYIYIPWFELTIGKWFVILSNDYTKQICLWCNFCCVNLWKKFSTSHASVFPEIHREADLRNQPTLDAMRVKRYTHWQTLRFVVKRLRYIIRHTVVYWSANSYSDLVLL